MEILLPAELVAVNLTVYVPALEYVCDGFWEMSALPSPKFQFHEVGVLVELSVNVTVNGALPEVGVPTKLVMGGTTVAV